ncbi:MAG: hypothetical protein IPK04_15545 [Bdellovibrionales bacterium]|nr:hypothetical protein [Bdellovibrionales bacterium]
MISAGLDAYGDKFAIELGYDQKISNALKVTGSVGIKSESFKDPSTGQRASEILQRLSA